MVAHVSRLDFPLWRYKQKCLTFLHELFLRNYQMPDCHSTEQKELVVFNIYLSNSYFSNLKHNMENARFKIIQVKL